VEITAATWSRGAVPDQLELVAMKGGAVVGHVLAGWGSLGGREVVGVAPLAVMPGHQGVGIGTALMAEWLRRAESAHLPLAVLLGHPAYYGRFGFEPAGPLGIFYGAAGAGNPNFQVRRFSHYDPSYRGDYVYCWETEHHSD
jgi:predicted N-acetyltransferase YhbS